MPRGREAGLAWTVGVGVEVPIGAGFHSTPMVRFSRMGPGVAGTVPTRQIGIGYRGR